MARTNRAWAPLPAALLVAVLVGPGSEAGAAPRATSTRSLTIPAAAFSPASDQRVYGMGLSAVMGSTTGMTGMFAPVWFPVPEVTVKKITLCAYDGRAAHDLHLWASRVRPGRDLAQVAVPGAAGTLGDQEVSTTRIHPRLVKKADQAPVLKVGLRPRTYLRGVKITCSYAGAG